MLIDSFIGYIDERMNYELLNLKTKKIIPLVIRADDDKGIYSCHVKNEETGKLILDKNKKPKIFEYKSKIKIVPKK